MIYYTLPLLHKQATLEMVGGKGMSLSKLLTAGIPVPEGFHVRLLHTRFLLKRTIFSLTLISCWTVLTLTIPASLKMHLRR